MTARDQARWAAWTARVRKHNVGEVLFVEEHSDGVNSSTPGTVDDLDGPPPAAGVVVYATTSARKEPFVFHPSPGGGSAAHVGSPELKAILGAAKEGYSRYAELVEPTLVMYRDENARYIERVRELEGRVRELEGAIAHMNAMTATERQEENRRADTRHLVEKVLLPRFDRVMGAVDRGAVVQQIAADLEVLFDGLPDEVRDQIVAVDPHRAHRVLNAIANANANAGQ